MSDTIAAIATGNLISAIGIIRLSGDGAISIAEELFTPSSGKPLSEQPDRTLVYGTLRDAGGTVLDQCLCTVSRAPNSYTGENTAELQCHGSPTVLRLALESLFYKGARQALAGEFTKRAFLNGRMDLSQAEAVIDLIDSETADAARNAAAQLGGAMSRKMDSVYSQLVDIISHYHAVLDYPDEDIEDFKLEKYKSVFISSWKELSALLSTFERGRVMKSGVRAAILGRPNAGKSSLMNALLGYERAIVTDIPGTTRDTIEETLVLGGVKLRLTDTAGLRETSDLVESIGVQRARAAAGDAELALVLLDPGDISEEDQAVLEAAQGAKHIIVVLTKADITPMQGVVVSFGGLRVDELVSVSSLTGEGLDTLADAVSELFPAPEAPAGEIITNVRQADAIKRALESIETALETIGQGNTPDIVLTETENALSALGELTGRTVRDDVTTRIFERFCVGK